MNETTPNSSTPSKSPNDKLSAETASFSRRHHDTDREAATIPSSGQSDGLEVRGIPAIPGYEIISELGRGGMGVIYKARQNKLKRIVALKLILAGARASPDDLTRFRREAEAAAQLQHPNIVQVYEIGEHDDSPYLSMEFVDGGSLSDRLRTGPQSIRWAAQTVETLARAVQLAHQRGIIHRDLKPSNILLTHDGIAKIADFGLAKRLEGDKDQTQSGTILGTPSYMAPEQAGGQSRIIGPCSDVYSLGAILYELLTGRPPFRTERPLDTLMQVVSREPDRPRSIKPAVPRDLETICLHALAKEPRQRYASAKELADDLERFVNGRPIHARPVGRLEHIWRWCRRNPVLASLLTIVAGLMMVVGGLLLTRGNNSTTTAVDNSFSRVQQAGKLVIATDATYPPMAFQENGVVVGYDIDLAEMIANRLGLKLETVCVDWEWHQLVNRLNSHEFDMLISSVTETEERRKMVDFVGYTAFSTVIICKQGEPIKNEQDLAGKVVAVQSDTTAYRLAMDLKRKGVAFKQVAAFPQTTEPFAALQQGSADVTFSHEPVARYFVKRHPEFTFSNALNPPNEIIGIAFCKQDKRLQAAVADEIAKFKADGTMRKLAKKWFEH